MAESMFGLAPSERNTDPLVSQNIRKYVDKKTLANFTPEGRNQIAHLEEELFELHCRHRVILEQEGELVFILHDLILQEKYLQLNTEKRELASIKEEYKSKSQVSRENLITQGMNVIMERRECMHKEAEERRLRNEADNEERQEHFEKMKIEWADMKCDSTDFSVGWKEMTQEENPSNEISNRKLNSRTSSAMSISKKICTII